MGIRGNPFLCGPPKGLVVGWSRSQGGLLVAGPGHREVCWWLLVQVTGLLLSEPGHGEGGLLAGPGHGGEGGGCCCLVQVTGREACCLVQVTGREACCLVQVTGREACCLVQVTGKEALYGQRETDRQTDREKRWQREGGHREREPTTTDTESQSSSETLRSLPFVSSTRLSRFILKKKKKGR